ncbi:MAG: hypothetical protein GWP74_03105, partial [Proteobacteria bacterium]|nr:hypothetical protein [Pseudomonadota bacterium]
ARYETDRLAVIEEFEALQAQRSRRQTQFNSERERLNERIAAVNEQIALRDGRINEEQRIQGRHSPRYANDPRIKSLKEGIAAQLAEIDAVRSNYLTQSTATGKARAALTRQIEEYMNAGDPLALEIRSLDEDWQRFAETQRGKLKQVADDYAVDYAAYDKWLEQERTTLSNMRAAVASALETGRKQRALHAETDTALRSLIDEYNALVAVHNKAGASDPNRDQRAIQFAELEKQITKLQANLTRARESVLKVTEELTQGNQELTEHYEQFAAQKRERDTTLAADLAELNATRLTVEAAIDVRRRKVDTQIKSLEAHISGELRDARNNLETLNTRLIESFGRDHEGFDTAITHVLEMNDDGLLYTATGAPRFDLSRPLTADVYTAVDRLQTDRHKIDARIVAIEESEGGTQQSSSGNSAAAGMLERDQAVLSAERQQLLESYATSARQIQGQSGALEERRRAIDTRFADERALLGALYTARADVIRSEMQALQGVLVAAVTGQPDAAPGGSHHAQLMAALKRSAGQMKTPVDESILARHALMDQIASDLPDAGIASHPGDWQTFLSRKVIASKELTGTDKAAFAGAWLAHLRRQPRFIEIANALGASAAVTAGEPAFSNLFFTGVFDHSTITEQQLDGGGIGIQVNILGRVYQLTADGSLEALPSG